MTADKIADFLDRISLRISKRTFVVLDNASVYRYRLMRELRPIWEKHALFLVFISPYISHLINITEIFDTSLKGNGSNLWGTSPQMSCSMPLTESWRQSAPESKSILPIWLSINYFLWPTYFDKPFILCYIYGSSYLS